MHLQACDRQNQSSISCPADNDTKTQAPGELAGLHLDTGRGQALSVVQQHHPQHQQLPAITRQRPASGLELGRQPAALPVTEANAGRQLELLEGVNDCAGSVAHPMSAPAQVGFLPAVLGQTAGGPNGLMRCTLCLARG